MSALQAIPTQHGIDILNSELKNTVTKYQLIGALTHDALSESLYSFHEDTIETSYYDENGVLTFILNLPIEQHFDEYLHQIHVLDSTNQSVIECSTPKVALAKGIGGMVTLKAAISGEAGEVIFKHNEFVTETELVELHLSRYYLKTETKDLINLYGLSGLAPTAVEFGISSNDLNDITEDCQHLTLTGEWNNTPFGDGVGITGQLTVYRRYFDAGAAVVQILHHQDGRIYHRVGSGVPITFPDSWNKLLFASDVQNLPYDPDRKYKYLDVVKREVNGVYRLFEWYSPVESLAGKDPADPANRRPGWTDTTKPFYWKPYTTKIAGETMGWDDDNLPEIMMVGAGQQVSALTYHTLAAAKPQWIDGVNPNLLNIPDRQGRFTRAADGTTWIASQTHEDDIKSHYHTINDTSASGTDVNSSPYADTGNGVIDDSDLRTNSTGGNETMPKGYIEWIGYAL